MRTLTTSLVWGRAVLSISASGTRQWAALPPLPAPPTRKALDVTLISATAKSAADARSWQPHAPADPLRATLTHVLSATVQDVPAGEYLVGIALPDPRTGFEGPGCCVRFANLNGPGGDFPYWSAGVNVIGKI